MNKSLKKLALVALCTSALTGVSQAAVLFSITGVPTNAFTYGTLAGANNVINAGASVTGSGVSDGAAPTTWLGSGGITNGFVSVSGLLPTQQYTISFTYIGSESDNTIRFTVGANATATLVTNGVAGTNDDNRNNSCITCQPGHVNPAATVPMGSVLYKENGGTNVPGFNLRDIETGANITNGGVNGAPGSGIASLIYSYANCAGLICTLTTAQTAFVVFGFNDNGFGDDNHDDFMGLMSVVGGGTDQPTPIPGALPLFGTVLGGGLLFRRLRKRKAA